jgi:hypothetical protein
MGVMRLLNETGHVELAWEVGDQQSIATARGEFSRLRTQGYVPFQRSLHTKAFSRVPDFDEGSAEIFMLRPLRGG